MAEAWVQRAGIPRLEQGRMPRCFDFSLRAQGAADQQRHDHFRLN